MAFPLANLELTRSARRRSTHGLRLVAPAFCAVVLLVSWFFMTLDGSSLNDMANFSGSFLSYTVMFLQVFAACVLAPLFASGTIAPEKQERSIGLLLLADIRGGDLLISKGLVAFLQVELLILGCLPLQAIALLLGGLTLKMLVGQQIAAAGLCFTMTCFGLLCSTLAWRAVDAFLLTMGLEVLWFVVAGVLDSSILVPLGAGRLSGGAVLFETLEPGFSTTTVWLNLVYSLLVAAIPLGVAGACLPRLSDERAARACTNPWGRLSSRIANRVRPVRLDPVGMLYAANVAGVGGAMFRWPWQVFLLIGTMLLGVIPFGYFLWVIPILILYDITSSLTAARANGGLDLLYTTNVEDSELARGIFRTHIRRSMIFLPALILNTIISCTMFYVMMGTEAITAWDQTLFWFYMALSLCSTIVDVFAYVCLGCAAATWKGAPAMQTFRAVLALFGVYILALILASITGGILGGRPMALGILASGPNPTAFMIPMQIVKGLLQILTLLAFAVRWRGSFGRKLSTQWRTAGSA